MKQGILFLDGYIKVQDKIHTVHDAIIKHWQYLDFLYERGHIKLSTNALCLLIRVRNDRTGENRTGNIPELDSKKDSGINKLINDLLRI